MCLLHYEVGHDFYSQDHYEDTLCCTYLFNEVINATIEKMETKKIPNWIHLIHQVTQNEQRGN